MRSSRGTAAFLGLAGALLAVLAITVPTGAQGANSLVGSPYERAAQTDSVAKSGVGDSTSAAAKDSLARSLTDSGLVVTDSAKTALDSAATRQRSLPPRTLTLRQQVMFAGGFMAFIALMMASMQNFNP